MEFYLGDEENEKKAAAEPEHAKVDYKKDITAFDQKQKDLVLRALIYYRKKKYGTSVDKGVGVSLFW